MRLWTLHPRYLDPRGLVALWRESLLAQRVLEGKTRGYRHHPQLFRFKESPAPLHAIGAFLKIIHGEATNRGYAFNESLILEPDFEGCIEETEGQLLYELGHLQSKVASRSPRDVWRLASPGLPEASPLFRIVPGEVQTWETGARRTGGEA